MIAPLPCQIGRAEGSDLDECDVGKVGPATVKSFHSMPGGRPAAMMTPAHMSRSWILLSNVERIVTGSVTESPAGGSISATPDNARGTPTCADTQRTARPYVCRVSGNGERDILGLWAGDGGEDATFGQSRKRPR
jgi:hypothetical protein